MFLSFFIVALEYAQLTVESANVIGMRVQMIAKADELGQHEAELMVLEKLDAFGRATADMMAGVSNSIVRQNLRAIGKANETRLKALRWFS